MTSRGVQTQLTEEAEKILREDKIWREKRNGSGVVNLGVAAALADAYLAQQRVIEAAGRDFGTIADEAEAILTGVALTSMAAIRIRDRALVGKARAAVSVGSPETETEE